MANEIVYFLKTHRRQIMSIGKKIFRWLQNKKNTQGQPGGGGGGGGGYAGAAAAGAAAGGGAAYYGQQQHQQQQQQPSYNQQVQPVYGNNQQGGWDHPPPQGNYGQPTLHPGQPPNGIKPNHGRYNDNEVNQKNERYRQLRAQAQSEGDKMAKCFDASHKAYSQGDGGRAKQLSNEGHEHKLRMEQLNGEAADWIYKANNEDSSANEVDLHGLYTQEAIAKTEQAIRQAQQQGMGELRVIVGKGIHSKDHVAHIKPAIEKLMQDYGIAANLDPKNAGVLLVHLGAAQGNAPQGAYRDAGFANQLAQQASGKDDQCTIM
jgi:DNA-nicking Smr family endonuclease